MENINNVDLTRFSHTYPESVLSNEILADSKIREIQRKFSKDSQKIIIVGPDGCGKTTLLTQFVEVNKTLCFSYFFTDNYWSLRPTAFLSSICKQMSEFLGLNSNKDFSEVETRIDLEKQQRIFDSLVQQVIERIKQTNLHCYFVIDGLEHVFQGKTDDDFLGILQLLTNPRGLFYLGSVSSVAAKKIPFKYLQEEPHFFSKTETTKYLEQFQLNETQIEKLQNWSGGMPGLLMLAKEMISDIKRPIDEIINEPQNFEKLLEIQWINFSAKFEEDSLDILAVIAYSLIPLDLISISKILETDLKRTEKYLATTGLLKILSNQCFTFYPEAYKNYAKTRLTRVKTRIIEKFVNYYTKNNFDNNAKILLPQYLGIIENYDALKQLLTPDYLLDLSTENRDISLAQKNMANSIELGKKRQDIGIIKFSLASAQLHELTNQLFGFSEVIALIALKKFDQALELAYSTNITTTRIRLLARIYWSMEKSGQIVQRKAIDELIILAENLNTENLDPETILNTAADLFPVLPDFATQLVDRAKQTHSAQTPVELFALMTSVSSEDPESETLLSKITNEKMRDFALSHSPWLSKLSAESVVRKAKSLQVTKAKEYLLRRWCRENPRNPDICFVIENALEIIASDNNYHIPLRNLRQLSDMLKYCPESNIIPIIKRFEIPLFSSLQSPIQEKVRLELNFVEALYKFDQDESVSRLKLIHQTICNSELDSDVICVCLSSLLVTIKRIDPEDTLKLSKCVQGKLEDEYIQLMENSASQLDVTKKVLRSIALINIDLALAFAGILNTAERRDFGTQEVLASYVRLDIKDNFTFVVRQALNRFVDTKMRDQCVLKILEILTKSKIKFDESILEFFCEITDLIVDPLLQAKCYSYVLTQALSKERIEQTFEKLKTSWDEIDIVWIRIECAFEIVNRLSDCLPVYAAQLFTNAKALVATTSLANQSIGIMYYESIRLAAKLYGNMDLSTETEKVKYELMSLIDRIPSRLLRIRVLSHLALSLLRNGCKKEADTIIQEKIITGLQNCKNSNLQYSVISELAIVLYEYSPEEANSWVNKLPYLIRNVTWVKVIVRLLTQSYMTDKYDEDAPLASINLQTANQILKIISFIERDNDIYLAVKILTRAISEDFSKLTEKQKLDLLGQIEYLANQKLPDQNNIKHNGYLALALGEIECARWKSAKLLKTKLPKYSGKIITMAKGIENVADRVLVLSELGVLFQKNQNETANRLLEEALTEVNQIHNVKDRLERLEIIADCYGRMRNTSKVTEIIKIGEKIAESFDGIEKDQILSSIIQTAYQYNKEFASELSEKIEDLSTQYELDLSQKALDLSRAPQKILSLPNESKTPEVLNEAAGKMNKLFASGRNSAIPKSTILDWLVSIRNSDYSNCDEVIGWAVESLINQSSESEVPIVATEIVQSLMFCGKLMMLFGSQVTNLSTIPDDLKPNFQGYSLNKKYYEAGDRQKIKTFISTWIKENAKLSIVICDPYFDPKQLWILQLIPNDVTVKILCTTKGFGIQKKTNLDESINNREILREVKIKIKNDMLSSWNEISSQNPPRTMVIIQNTIFEDDELHDRFILSKDSGLSIGTSLSGFGKKEFFITTISSEDVNFVNEKYITPKIKLEEIFSDVIFFELE